MRLAHASTMLHPTYWPHSGLWTLEDGRSSRTLSALRLRVGEVIADYLPLGRARALPRLSLLPATGAEIRDIRARRRKIRGLTVAEREAIRARNMRDVEESDQQEHEPEPKRKARTWSCRVAPEPTLAGSSAPPPSKRYEPSGVSAHGRLQWTPEDDAYLRERRADGVGHTQIAREMRLSRNAVIGREHRLREAALRRGLVG